VTRSGEHPRDVGREVPWNPLAELAATPTEVDGAGTRTAEWSFDRARSLQGELLAWPPGLPEQPIFYPALNLAYAARSLVPKDDVLAAVRQIFSRSRPEAGLSITWCASCRRPWSVIHQRLVAVDADGLGAPR